MRRRGFGLVMGSEEDGGGDPSGMLVGESLFMTVGGL